MIGATGKSGKNNYYATKDFGSKKYLLSALLGKRSVTKLWGNELMTTFVFIFVYYLGKRIFINFGISDRNRFFVALTIGLILETVVFAITGTSGYKLISPMWLLHDCGSIYWLRSLLSYSQLLKTAACAWFRRMASLPAPLYKAIFWLFVTCLTSHTMRAP